MCAREATFLPSDYRFSDQRVGIVQSVSHQMQLVLATI
jgi:hypothetical protein